MNRYSAHLLSLAALLLLSCGGSNKADVARKTGPGLTTGSNLVASEDPPLPLDSRVRKGVLDNGLTYYVLEHQVPEERAQLWLGVNAGSVLEDDDQQGLAHFVEHMAFNGTAKYQKMAIVNYLESIGMKFGPDVNAYTSFDQTVYMLQVPTDDEAILNKGFDILHQWAGSISFEVEEVDKERGVVTEEWRLGQGAGMRIANKQYPLLFAGSKYAERLPIGKPEILKSAPRDTLARFYKDWYRPNLMAIVAVGDFDGAKVEAAIKAQFSDLKNPDNERPRPIVSVPNGDAPLVSIETDKEMQRTTISIQTRMKHRPMASKGDYRRSIGESLYHAMFNARLREIAQKPDAPFLFAYSSTSGQVRTSDSFTRFAMVKESSVQEALQLLSEETRRVELHGFTETEFERSKVEMLRGYKRNVLERDKRDGTAYASEILRNFFEDETMPGSERELALLEEELPTFTLDEINRLADQWKHPERRVVMIAGPEGLKAPAKAEVISLLAKVDSSQPAAYQDEVLDQPLLAATPKAGTITKTRVFDEIGVTEWTLSNGAKVVVKPTDFKNDEIQFSAFSPGGFSLVGDADYHSARAASAIVGRSGVGQHDATQLGKQLSGKVLGALAYVSELEEGMWGSASPKDLQSFFELIHLRFTAPRMDADAFAAWKSSQQESVRNRRMSPEGSFFDDMGVFLTQNHLRRRPMTLESLDEVDHARAFAIFKERFADSSDFTFVFVGNIDLAALRPMVETYIASLPSTGRKEKWKDPRVKMPKGRQEKTVVKGIEPKSYLYLTFHGKEKSTPETRNNMQALTEILRIRLREVLREDMGGVYGVRAGGSIDRRPTPEYGFTVSFGCDPDKVEDLKKGIFDTIAEVQKNGIEASYIEKVVTSRKRQHELDLKDNGYWSRELVEAYRFGDNLDKLLDDSLLDQVSSKQVKAAANKYLRNKEYILGVLRPEEAPAAATKAAE